MKKIISLTLVLIMMLTLAVPAFAVVDPDYNVPMITLRGDGAEIYDASGENVVWPPSFGDEEGDKDALIDSIADVLFPHLATGLLTGNYEGYYDAFYDAMLPLFEDSHLDGDGNPSNGTQLDPEMQAENIESVKYDKKYWHGNKYDKDDYTFRYDWRLSPLETAEKLDEYIAAVMARTGAKQVSLVGLCLGGCPVMAYLNLYLNKLEANPGMTPYIKNVMFDATVANDCTAFTDAFRGKVDLDVDALQRFMDEYADPDENSFNGLEDGIPFLNELLFTTYELLRETGVADTIIGDLEDFYGEIYEGLVPKLAIVSYGNFPGYWASVDPAHYEEARDFVFADPELREEYAGFIAKTDKYYNEVSSRRDEIIAECQAKGTHFGAIAKYGTQAMPFTERQNELSDRLVTLESASFGATTSLATGTLSDEYIAERIELGYGDYISADKKVDLSTGLLKDTTWIIKNCNHDNWSHEEPIVEAFCHSTGMTTNNDKTWARFLVCDDETGTLTEMTEENPGEDLWEDTKVETKDSTIWTKLAALFRWITALLKAFTHLLNK
ncbi:MAG: hypothetical protein IJ491_06565 [Clostridia bacterium]|nr:hypothetical protein [Clostridia bacterium]